MTPRRRIAHALLRLSQRIAGGSPVVLDPPIREAAEWTAEIVHRNPDARVEGAIVLAEVRNGDTPGTAVIWGGHMRELTRTADVVGTFTSCFLHMISAYANAPRETLYDARDESA